MDQTRSIRRAYRLASFYCSNAFHQEQSTAALASISSALRIASINLSVVLENLSIPSVYDPLAAVWFNV
jgi:hypothetical protein